MDLMLKKLRADFDLVARARLEAGEWSEDDIKEFSACIKACVDGKDHVNLASWARWLADLAHSVIFFNMVVKGSEVAMRNAAAAERAKKAGGK